MARHDAQVVIPLNTVVADYFPHLTADSFIRRMGHGDIRIPVIRIDASSQKSAKGVRILDLANYIDTRREAAAKEVCQLTGKV
jgi:hypothetical protein